MDRLRLRGSVVPPASEVLGHADRRIVSDLFTPLTDGALARATLCDGVFITATTITLAMQGLPPILPCFAVAETGGIRADVYGVRISEVLERGCLVGA